MFETPPPRVGKSVDRKAYQSPSMVSYGADELRSFLGVAYAMSSGGDGGGRVDTLTDQIVGGSGRGSSLNRR